MIIVNHHSRVDAELSLYGFLRDVKLPPLVFDEVIALIKKNDKAHDLDHIYGVVLNVLDIIEKTSVELKSYEVDMCVIAAFMHDIGSHVDRKNHHIVGAKMALDILRDIYPRDVTYRIANAIAQHRASFKEARVDPVAEVVALADRGRMNKIEAMFIRGCTALAGSTDKVIPWHNVLQAFEHGIDKFGPKGYAWNSLPELAIEWIGDDIDRVKRAFTSENYGTFITHLMEEGMIDYSGDHWHYDQPSGELIKGDL